MAFPADIGGRQSMSSWTSRVFPPSAWLSQLGTAGPPPGLSCLEYHGMPRRALGEASRGVLQLSFHMSPPHFKQQGYGGCRFHIFPSLREKPLPPLWSMWRPFPPLETSGNPGSRLGQHSYLAVSFPTAQSRALRALSRGLVAGGGTVRVN